MSKKQLTKQPSQQLSLVSTQQNQQTLSRNFSSQLQPSNKNYDVQIDLNQNDSEDEEITYLTSLKNCESKYKRIQTANTHRKSTLVQKPLSSNKNQAQFNNFKNIDGQNRIMQNFFSQSVIAKQGLEFFEGNLVILESQDQRFAENIYTKHSVTEPADTNQDDRKHLPRMRVIMRDIIKSELSNNQVNLVHFHQYVFKYLEVKIKGKNKPLFFFFNYADQKSNYKMFISRFTYTPNIFNCENVFPKKTILKYTEPGDFLSFQSDSVFLAIYPQQQSSIQIKLQFGQGYAKKEKNNDQDDRVVLSDYALRKQIQIIKEKRREAMLGQKGEDLIKINMDMNPHKPLFKDKALKIRRIQSAVKIGEILEKKQRIDEEKKNTILLKWEHSEKVKILREIFKYYIQIEQNVQSQQRTWFSYLQVIRVQQRIRYLYFVIFIKEYKSNLWWRNRNKYSKEE